VPKILGGARSCVRFEVQTQKNYKEEFFMPLRPLVLPPVKYLIASSLFTASSLSHFLFLSYLFVLVLVSLLPVLTLDLHGMNFISFFSPLFIQGGGQDDAVRCWGSWGLWGATRVCGYYELLEARLR
jgi:hypothetical protein